MLICFGHCQFSYRFNSGKVKVHIFLEKGRRLLPLLTFVGNAACMNNFSDFLSFVNFSFWTFRGRTFIFTDRLSFFWNITLIELTHDLVWFFPLLASIIIKSTELIGFKSDSEWNQNFRTGFEVKNERWMIKKGVFWVERSLMNFVWLIHKVQEISGNVQKNSKNEYLSDYLDKLWKGTRRES